MAIPKRHVPPSQRGEHREHHPNRKVSLAEALSTPKARMFEVIEGGKDITVPIMGNDHDIHDARELDVPNSGHPSILRKKGK